MAPSLFLFTDTHRYLFNCGENLQRLSMVHRVRLTKVKNVFVTRVTWRNLGGFPGLSMFMKMNTGSVHFALHGPESLAGFVQSSRQFLGKEEMKIDVPRECVDSGSLPVYKDENITVTTIEFQVGDRLGEGVSSGSDSDGEPEAKKPKRSVPSVPPIAAFVCKLADVPGKFNPQSAVELGLPRGPAYKKLVQGESVTTPEGRIIQPEDVVGPKQVGPSFVVVECPRSDFVPSVTSHPCLQNDTFVRNKHPLALIVHITPPEVLASDKYSRWMASFAPETKHLLLEKGVAPNQVSLQSILKLQTPLHLMNPLVHQLPAALVEESSVDLAASALQKLPKESVIVGEVLLRYDLKPVAKAGVDRSATLGTVREAVEEELKEIQTNPQLVSAVLHPGRFNSAKPCAAQSSETAEVEREKTDESSQAELPSVLKLKEDAQISLSQLIAKLLQPPLENPLRSDDVLISFPGTGAACPSKYRNVSGILLQVPSSGNILLDCGEGTLSQIYQTFGPRGGDDIVRNLRAVFISHIHGDHHFGAFSVLQRQAELLAREVAGSGLQRVRGRGKTIVIGPPSYGHWLREYNQLCERVPYRFVHADSLCGEESGLLSSAASHLREKLPDFSIQTVPVVHCRKAYGVIVEHKTGWKIVYSGDTRPCPRLAEAGQNASLLIHEATFEDDLESDAIAKRHCTISEALDIARQMNPNFTIFTHFSQRYPKVFQGLLNGEQLKGRVAMAFDCMSIRLSEVHSLPTYLPAMKEIFTTLTEDDLTESSAAWSW